MAGYIARTCPRCCADFWVTVSHPTPRATEFPIIAFCVVCGYRLNGWRLILGRKPKLKIHHDRILKVFR